LCCRRRGSACFIKETCCGPDAFLVGTMKRGIEAVASIEGCSHTVLEWVTSFSKMNMKARTNSNSQNQPNGLHQADAILSERYHSKSSKISSHQDIELYLRNGTANLDIHDRSETQIGCEKLLIQESHGPRSILHTIQIFNHHLVHWYSSSSSFGKISTNK